MSAWLLALAGVCLGAVAGLSHLWLTRWRAGVALRRGGAAAFLTYPLALGAVALPVVMAASLAPLAAWCVIPGLIAVRFVVLRREVGQP